MKDDARSDLGYNPTTFYNPNHNRRGGLMSRIHQKRGQNIKTHLSNKASSKRDKQVKHLDPIEERKDEKGQEIQEVDENDNDETQDLQD